MSVELSKAIASSLEGAVETVIKKGMKREEGTKTEVREMRRGMKLMRREMREMRGLKRARDRRGTQTPLSLLETEKQERKRRTSTFEEMVECVRVDPDDHNNKVGKAGEEQVWEI